MPAANKQPLTNKSDWDRSITNVLGVFFSNRLTTKNIAAQHNQLHATLVHDLSETSSINLNVFKWV